MVMDPPLPSVVRRLDEILVNRIAAGEIIQRPANAVKELMENSLDAGATSIQITLKSGGMKLLQIEDNGSGIRKEDLEIVCERYTTSKISAFEDLNSISTYGFRGEALASISLIAHLTIVTKTAAEECAYRVSYKDGKPAAPAKACAGNQGTRLIVEDLFFNDVTRKKSLTNFNDEHARAAEVVRRYAIHNPCVGFMLRKADGLPDVKTNSKSTRVDNIRLMCGNDIAKNLTSLNVEDEMLKFRCEGYISRASCVLKKQIFILFINDRLVESPAFKKRVEQVYSMHVPKGTHAFAYLSLKVDARNVDVNVHPTKHEVRILNEEQIMEKIMRELETKFVAQDSSRIFFTKAIIPNDSKFKMNVSEDRGTRQPAPKDEVRCDPKSQKLDKFFKKESAATGDSGGQSCRFKSEKETCSWREIRLTSILKLRGEVKTKAHAPSADIFQNFVYVGAISPTFSVVQHRTELYLCNNYLLAEEFFYQLMLVNFGNFGRIMFPEPIPLDFLLELAISLPECGWKGDENDVGTAVQAAISVISPKSSMLQDYFCLEIDADRNVTSLPLLLEDYIPDQSGFPEYILKLCTEVTWNKEEDCFRSFCRETARFYANCLNDKTPFSDEGSNQAKEAELRWTLEYVLYPAMKKNNFSPDRNFMENGHILQIASLPKLYTVFERC